MKTSQLLLGIALLLCSELIAQKKVAPTPEHIAQANSLKEIYEEDDVVILQSTEQVHFALNKSKELVTVSHKVEEELMNISDRADIQKYVFYDDASEVVELSTRLRNGKGIGFRVTDEFYKSEDIFYHDARVKYMSIDFPLKAYKYFYKQEKRYKDSKYFTNITFNNVYPILEKKVSFYLPEWLDVELLEFNFDGFDISKSVEEHPYKNISEVIYTIKSLDGLPKEKNSPGPSFTNPHVLVVVKSMEVEGVKTTLFKETKQLYKWYKSLVDSMDDDPSVLEEVVAKLTKGASSDEEKIKNIYYWVQDNIRYIAFEDGIAGFKPEGSQTVFKNRYGDCKGMANLTKQMLIKAGFDARLTWIGTKRIAYDYSIPSLAVDNHMICSLIHNDKTYFLDGTEKYNSFGEYAERIQGRPVLIENGVEYILKRVPVANAEDNTETVITEFSIEGESLVGHTEKTYKGESRAHFIYGYNSIKTDSKDNALKFYLDKGDKNRIVSNVITSDLENRDLDVSLSHDLRFENKVSSFDDELYVDLEYAYNFKNLDLAERKTAVEFPYKMNISHKTILNLPEGYTIKEMPKSVQRETDDFKIALNFEQSENTLIYTKRFIFKNAGIPKTDFNDWIGAHKKFKESYQHQLILSKTENQTAK